MVLLDIAQTDGGLGLAALISSLGGGASLLIKFIVDKTKMRGEISQLKIDNDKLETAFKEKLIEVTASKKAMRKELMAEMEKQDQILHQRIDRVRDDNLNNYNKLEKKMDRLEQKYDDNTKTILDALKK